MLEFFKRIFASGSSYNLLMAVLILVIPFSTKLPNVILAVLLLFFVINWRESKKANFNFFLASPFIFLSIFIVYTFAKGIFIGNLSDNKFSLLPLLFIIPFLFTKVKNFSVVLFSVVVSSAISALWASFHLAQHYLQTKSLDLYEGGQINVLLGMERPYLAFFCTSGILAALVLIKSFQSLKYYLINYIIFIILFIVTISARASVGTIVILGILYLLFYYKVTLAKKLLFVFGIAVIVISSIAFNQNLKERFFVGENISQTLAKVQEHEPRVIIWNCVAEITQEADFNKIIGFKNATVVDNELAKCYDATMANKHRADFFKTAQYNTHNQFLGLYMGEGLIGVVLLISFFVGALLKHYRNFYKTAIIIALLLFFVVENVIQRQLGMYFFAICISLITLYNTDKQFSSVEE